MTTTDPRPPTPTHRPATHRPSGVLPAATAYVAAWLAGLAVLPEAVDAHADAGTIGRYLVAHAGAAVLQSWLVHGVAAVALVWFVRSALAVLGQDEARPPALHRLTRWAALGAGAASLLQVVLLHAAVLSARSGSDGRAARWVHAVNGTDVVKLVLLGAVVAGTTLALGRAAAWAAGVRVWFTWPATALAVMLPVAGLAFVSTAPWLGGMLALSLVLLLTWAVAAAVLVTRRRGPAAGERAPGRRTDRPGDAVT